jgi:hypothetical protein
MGPQDPKDVTRDIARDLSALVGELAALKGDAAHWLTDPEYAVLRHRLEAAHAAYLEFDPATHLLAEPLRLILIPVIGAQSCALSPAFPRLKAQRPPNRASR